MDNNKTHFSEKAFVYAIITIVLFIVFIVLKKLVGAEAVPSKNYAFISAVVMFLVVLFSFIGFIYNLRGIKEPKSFKKISSFIVNGILMILFVITTVVNLIEIYQTSASL
ncbi:hypothetical protein AB9K26_09575 [Psychroserpens sp. XS_ASV72]|uniref:hypothetical protein n=1 Tax=Psychroserpens sp. XS_ASV72 TaxID=3241293 RepID=UPI003515C064